MLVGLIGLAIAGAIMAIYIPIRNALDFEVRRHWGSELYMASIRQLESPVYLSTSVCEDEEDPPYLFSAIPDSLEAARAGTGAAAVAGTKQLLRRRASLTVDGVEYVAVEARHKGNLFRGWLRARSCGGVFASEFAQSGLYTPIKGPWTEQAHRDLSEWIRYDTRYRATFVAALGDELSRRGIRLRKENSKDFADLGLEESYTTPGEVVEADNVFRWNPVVKGSDLPATGFAPGEGLTLIRKSDARGFRAAVNSAVIATAEAALELDGLLEQGNGIAAIESSPTEEATGTTVVPADAGMASPPLAADIYGNVQVLTDLRITRFTEVMTRMTEAVGQEDGCTHCHNADNYGDDSKQPFQVARNLLRTNRNIDESWRTQFVAMVTEAEPVQASFDCGNAATRVERMICGDPRIAAMDRELAAAFRHALTVTEEPSSLRQGQRTWVREVQSRCESTSCLSEAYSTRLAELTP